MIEVGRLCVKLAGRDSAKKCVVVEVLDNNFVMIDGETRRRKCNMIHLEPLDQKLKIKAKASHDSVVKAFKEELGIEVKTTKKKEAKERPRRIRKKKEKKQPEEALSKKVEKEDKKAKAKKAEKKEEPKPEAKPEEKK